MTKCGKIIGVKRPTLTICAMLAAAVFSAGAETAHPLEEASREAFRLCAQAAPNLWLDECGAMSGSTAAHSAARRALIRMHNQRTSFMNACQGAETLENCRQQAEWHMGKGFTRALDVETADLTGSLPRSDKRR
jgi:hypothetical protein